MTHVQIRRQIAHREYSLFGANAEIYACLERTGMLESFLSEELRRDIVGSFVPPFERPEAREGRLLGPVSRGARLRVSTPFTKRGGVPKLTREETEREVSELEGIPVMGTMDRPARPTFQKISKEVENSPDMQE